MQAQSIVYVLHCCTKSSAYCSTAVLEENYLLQFLKKYWLQSFEYIAVLDAVCRVLHIAILSWMKSILYIAVLPE